MEKWLNSFKGWRFAFVLVSHSEDGVACHCLSLLASFQSFCHSSFNVPLCDSWPEQPESSFLLLLLALTLILEVVNSNIVCFGKQSSEKNWSCLPLIPDVWLTTDNVCRARENWGWEKRSKSTFPSPWWRIPWGRTCFPDIHFRHLVSHCGNMYESLLGALDIVWTFILLYAGCSCYLSPGRC